MVTIGVRSRDSMANKIEILFMDFLYTAPKVFCIKIEKANIKYSGILTGNQPETIHDLFVSKLILGLRGSYEARLPIY